MHQIKHLEMNLTNNKEVLLEEQQCWKEYMVAALKADKAQSIKYKHPTIASEYVKFLATNSGFEVVASLEAKMDSLNKELATTKKAATSAGNAAETAKNTVSEAKKIA